MFSNEAKQIDLLKISTHSVILRDLCAVDFPLFRLQCLFLDRVGCDDHGHIHSEAGQEVLHSGHHNQ